MRPPKAITRLAALAALALPTQAALARQAPVPAPAPAPDAVSPLAQARGARPLLRNGLDYISYGEYERALEFLRAAETRRVELTPAERQQLAQGIAKAQQGLRAADPGTGSGTVVAGTGKAPAQARLRAGAVALTPPPEAQPGPPPILAQTPAPAFDPAPAQAPAPAPAMAPEPIQLTGGTAEPMGFGVSRATGAAPAPPSLPIAPAPSLDQRPAGPSAVAAMEPPAALPDLPTLGVQEGDPLASDLPAMPSQAPDPASASASALDTSATAASAAVAADPIPDLPPSPSTTGPDMTEPIRSRPEPTPEVEVEAPAIEDPAPPALATPEPPPSIEAPALPALEMPDPTAIEAPAPAPTPAPASDPGLPSVAPEPAAAPEPVSEPGLPSLPALPMEAAALQPAGPAMPPLPGDEPPAPAAEELMAAPSPAPEMGMEMAPEPSASPSPPTAADAARDTTLGGALDPAAPAGNGGETILPETMRREVEDVARAYQRDVINQRSQIREPMRQGATPLGAGPLNLPGGVPSLIGPPLPSGGETSPSESRIELPRVPSPTEPRPIRSIPVPEEFVPLKPRAWTPSRKVWAAAATCHTPLYFQDAPLERYGLGVEQALGPHYGRFASIPLDDPTQSNQRQQLLQPFWSVGKFGAQIALWPVNMIFNPPWESEYDLGYWRPGDRVPPDTLYWPLTGVGPPFRGKKY